MKYLKDGAIMAENTFALPIMSAVSLFEDKQSFNLLRIVPVEQTFSRKKVVDLPKAVNSCCDKENLSASISAGMTVGVACGSRGISGIAEIVKALCDYLRRLGAKPVIIPAMGSHGGPSAEGQVEVLQGYGISEHTINVPIVSSLAVRKLAETDDGMPVWFSEDALACDKVIVINRIKPHTDFCDSIESGIMKMCAIGLGKQKGASYIHQRGFADLGKNIKKAARIILAQANVIGGLAIVENAYKDVACIDFLPTQGLEQREEALLVLARSLMPRLPLEKIDMLLVQRIGKDISGAMFDPNITGRRKIWGVADLPRPQIGVMAALELTEASHGNAAGLSCADICSLRLLQQVDFAATYASLITATLPQHAHVPMFFAKDDDIIICGGKISRCQDPKNMIFCWIEDTAHITKLWISEKAVPLLDVNQGAKIIGSPRPLPFNEQGLLNWLPPQ